MKKLFIFLMLGLFLISFASAMTIDNFKYNKDITFNGESIQGNKLLEKYKPIEIKNIFGLGETLFEGYISKHDEVCGSICDSTIEVRTGKDGVLIEDIRFLTLQEDNSWLEQPIRKSQFYINTDNQKIDVDDYETQCAQIGIFPNGTIIKECNRVKVGSHKEDSPMWTPYNIGDSIKKGTYQVKLQGKKKSSRTVDWQIKTNGKWLESWATWGNISDGDDAEVTLNYPIDGNESLTSIITFNATANITGGSFLTNLTLWNNESGWSAKNTTNLDAVITDGENIGADEGSDATIIIYNLTAYTGGYITTVGLGTSQGDTIDTYTAIIQNGVTIANKTNSGWKNNDAPNTTFVEADYSSLISPTTDGGNFSIQIERTGGTAPGFGKDTYSEDTNIYFKDYGGQGIGKDGGQSPTPKYIFNATNTTSSTQTWAKTITDSTLWNVKACDSDGDCGFAPNNFTALVDAVYPTFVVENPTGVESYGAVGQNETLNITFTDANLESCWYDYNGTNVTITNCLTGVKNSTNFLLDTGDTDMIIYANDSVSNLNTTTISWSYNLTENSQTYPSTAVESETKAYTANLSYNSSAFSVITALLNFNGSTYAGTNTGSVDSAIFSANAIMPNVATATNLTAYWTVSLTDVSGTIDYNLTSNNVTVSIINLSLCDSPLTVPFWNFTILNESNSAEINSTFEATFTVKASGSTTENEFSYSDTAGTSSQFDFCMSPSDSNFTVGTAIKLTKDGYVDKFYNFEEIALTNTTREDNLYMLTTGDSTSFIVHVVDVSGTDFEEVEVRVQRYYPGSGLWITTEILTTNNAGEAVGHLLSEDADYRFRVYQDGISIHNSSDTKITCATAPCTVTLVIPISIASGFEELESLTTSLSYSETTNVFTYTYSDTSSSFTNARLHVYKVVPTNATIISPCNETKTDATGVITCDLTGQVNGTYRAAGYITRGTTETLVQRRDGVLGTNIYNSIGLDGVLWSIFIFIAIVMLGISRPSLAIIFGTVGIVFLGLTGIINIGALSIVAISAIAIILLVGIGKE